MSDINFCNTKEQLNHLGEVVTGKVDGSPSGADIETSTLPYTGQVRKTLPALEEEYLEAIRSAGGVSVGTWTSGVTTFNAYNEYSVYNGIPYKPRTTTSLPYVAQGVDPTVAPDDANVQPYQELSEEDIKSSFATYGSYSASVISDIDLGKTVGWVDAEDTVSPAVGQLWSVEDYALGNNSGRLFFRVAPAGTGTHDGGKYIDLPTSGLQLVQNLPKIINAKCFGLKGNYTDDDLVQLIKLWDYAPGGSSILYPAGHYKLDGGVVHPLKQLHHHGVGRSPTFIPAANNIRGTSFYFPTYAGVNKGGIYMPPPSGSDFCRFSSFNDITLFGDGTNDDNGTVTCLKINNLGTHLNRVDSRYGAVGVENNYSVGSKWSDVKALGAVYGIYHVYDVATPFGAEKNSVATENLFENIQVATSKTNVNAIGWYQDATCQYANNHHGGSFDCEQCYTGALFEGRIASKDHDGVQAHGSSAFQSVGNVIDSAWFEANTGDNLVLSYDPAEAEPALIVRGLYQDIDKIATASDSQNTLTTPTGDRPLKLGATKDAAQGQSGTWQSPFTASQYLLHGKEINTPLLRNIVSESVSKKLGNRGTINEKGGYSWTYAKDNVPLLGSTVNIANFDLFSSPFKSVMIEFSIEAVSVTGVRYTHVGTLLVDKTNDTFASSLLTGSSFFRPGGAPSLTLQAVWVSTNTFGLFFFKAPNVTEVINATVSLRCTIGAGSDGDRQSVLTTFGV